MLPKAISTRELVFGFINPTSWQSQCHSFLPSHRRSGRVSLQFPKTLARGFMQQEGSTLHIEPKRTARKAVKARAKSSAGSAISPHLEQKDAGCDEELFAQLWRKFCKTDIPILLRKQMQVVKELELELGEQLSFGGPRASLKGRPGALEDFRHRALYETLSDSEEKLQNFAARQVACRILGSNGYACEKCWLPLRDCMCPNLRRGSLPRNVCVWLYMHAKDFVRKNNTGKLLWQAFGDNAARLTICGIEEQEAAMWEVLEQAGRDQVWCIFPEKNSPQYQVVDIPRWYNPSESEEGSSKGSVHFILIDGTWNNSKSMVARLKERAMTLWGEAGMPCVALSPTSVSVMHDLRPQPSMDRTCTAAAAAQLLQELSTRPELSKLGFDKSAEILYAALDSLQNALVKRRARDGRNTLRIGRARYRADSTSPSRSE